MTSFPVLFDTELTGGQTLSTLILLDSIISVPPVGGFDENEMESRLKLKETIATCDKITLNFDDQDMATIKACLVNMKWNILSSFIYSFTLSFK